MKWCTCVVPLRAFLFACFLNRKFYITVMPAVFSHCKVDLWDFHGGFLLVFNKSWKPTPIYMYYQSLLFSFAPCLPDLPVAGLCLCIHIHVSVYLLTTKLGLSLHLIWTSIYCPSGSILVFSLQFSFYSYLDAWSMSHVFLILEQSFVHSFYWLSKEFTEFKQSINALFWFT